MPTTAGSLALKGSTPPDAFIVERLKAQGALILGKTNLSEWANYRSTQLDQWLERRGRPDEQPLRARPQPVRLQLGQRVAAAADLATVTIGTETDGSIVCPAGQNGDVGIKPTLGPGQPHRHRADLGRAGHGRPDHPQRHRRRRRPRRAHRRGPAPTRPPRPSAATCSATTPGSCVADALEGARIGVWREGTFGQSPETDAIMERTITRMKRLGATIVDPADIAHRAGVRPGEHGAAVRVQARRRGVPRDGGPRRRYPKTLADLIAFNTANAATELKYFGQEIFEQSQAARPARRPGVRRGAARGHAPSPAGRSPARSASTTSTPSSRRPTRRRGGRRWGRATTSCWAPPARRPSRASPT